MKNNTISIVVYPEDNLNKTNYLEKLNKILNEIRLLDKINQEIINKIWDSNIKYREWNKPITNLTLNFYSDRGKWKDFIFLASNLTSFTIEEIISSKLRIALLLFWRDIANKLSSDTKFKLQLKLKLSFTSED